MAKQNEAVETVEEETVVVETQPKPDVNPIIADGITLEQIQEDHETKSSAIRYLNTQGYERKHIAKFMGIRYQHVRNVLVTPLKGDIKPAETETEETEETESE